MHTLTLLVRSAFAQECSSVDRRYPAIESFFSRAGVLTHGEISVTGWICKAFGIEREHGLPIGALLAAAHRSQAEASESSGYAKPVSTDHLPYWACIDPVHLTVDRDSLILQPQLQLRLRESESSAFFSTLEAHFSSADMRMLQVDTGRWCIGTSSPSKLNTTEIELAEGRNVNELLPSGADGTHWQRNITEAQMLLHDHPVNVAREARGDSVVNSLWLWGGGDLPKVSSPFDRIIAQDALLRSLATLSATKLCKPSNSRADLSSTAPGESNGSQHEFVEFSPGQDSKTEDVLAELEAQWIAPAWRSLKSGSLDRLTLIVQLPGLLLECTCDRQARRRFWKRRRALSSCLTTLQAVA